jgi:hypothetical protein
MKRIAMAALVAHLAVPSVSAEDRSTNVRMTASGTMTATTINLQDNTITDDEDLAVTLPLESSPFMDYARTPSRPRPPSLPPHERRHCFSQLSTGRASFALMTEVSWS